MSDDFVARNTRHEKVTAATLKWLDAVVIGLNLCPFAKAVRQHQQIRVRVSDAVTPDQLQVDLTHELLFLSNCEAAQTDTTLLITPEILHDFYDYNDFLYQAGRLLIELGLEGTLQIASFHPRYQFAGSGPDDIENFTNRSPYPMLHILRESSVERGVAAIPDADTIVQRNLATLRQLGYDGWRALNATPDSSE